jgi:hypothetical protein
LRTKVNVNASGAAAPARGISVKSSMAAPGEEEAARLRMRGVVEEGEVGGGGTDEREVAWRRSPVGEITTKRRSLASAATASAAVRRCW